MAGGLCGGWFYWTYYPGWLAEQPARAMVQAFDRQVICKRAGSRWVRRLAGPFGYLAERADRVNLAQARLATGDAALLAGLPQLQMLNLRGTPLFDEDLAHVAKCGACCRWICRPRR